MTIPARYENGVFRSLQDAPIKEGTVTAFAGNSTADSSLHKVMVCRFRSTAMS
jgi:predicted DNA-binding antitoxin AbrB/MazE fold protein